MRRWLNSGCCGRCAGTLISSRFEARATGRRRPASRCSRACYLRRTRRTCGRRWRGRQEAGTGRRMIGSNAAGARPRAAIGCALGLGRPLVLTLFGPTFRSCARRCKLSLSRARACETFECTSCAAQITGKSAAFTGACLATSVWSCCREMACARGAIRKSESSWPRRRLPMCRARGFGGVSKGEGLCTRACCRRPSRSTFESARFLRPSRSICEYLDLGTIHAGARYE